jgi:hypothetical protein
MKSQKKRKGKAPSIQYGALPYREIKSGVEFLLVTSRETRRWIIPKGWPQGGVPPYRAPQPKKLSRRRELSERSAKKIGSYWYDKIIESGATLRCRVRVFPLRVTRQFKKWPEKRQRRTQWHSAAQASRRVGETYLRQIFRSFAKQRRLRG